MISVLRAKDDLGPADGHRDRALWRWPGVHVRMTRDLQDRPPGPHALRLGSRGRVTVGADLRSGELLLFASHAPYPREILTRGRATPVLARLVDYANHDRYCITDPS